MSTAPDTPATPPVATDQPNWAPAQRFATISAIVGLVAFVIIGAINLGVDTEGGTRQFFLSYLVGFIFWSGITLGAMALLMIHYLSKSSWGRLLNRPLEAATRCLPLVAGLFIPVVIGTTLHEHSPYWWSAPEHAHVAEAPALPEAKPGEPPPSEGDIKRAERIKYGTELIAKRVKEEQKDRDEGNLHFLSVGAFIVCGIVYFAIWGALIYFLNKWGRETMSLGGDRPAIEGTLKKAENLSGPGLILYAITITAMVSQWVMSLEVSWASTMFPVIFAVDQMLAALTFCVALFLTMSDKPPLAGMLRPKFQIDMGSFMLALTLFWSYTSFSQLMLVWIGNLPEEIGFYLKRSNPPMENGWWWVSAALIVFNFGCPFILLLFRDVKLHKGRLRAVALWLLVMYYLNVIWWIEPAVPHDHGVLYVLMDIGATVGIGGVWGLVFLWQLKQRPLLPVNQMYMLPEGHEHGHH